MFSTLDCILSNEIHKSVRCTENMYLDKTKVVLFVSLIIQHRV